MEKLNPALEPAASAEPEPLTLESLYTDKIFEAKHLTEPQWMRDSKRFCYLAEVPGTKCTTVWLYDIETGEKSVVIAPDVVKLPPEETKAVEPEPTPEEVAAKAEDKFLPVHGYLWSPDETQILLSRPARKRGFNEGDKSLYVYTLATKELLKITKDDAKHINAKWSPNHQRIAYVKNDDLYVADAKGENEIRLTDTATKTLYNGRFGWVYEEELDLSDGWAWSSDGRQIAYFQIDESDVPIVLIPNYDDLHCTPVATRYPKAGDPNPRVKIGVIEVPDAPAAAVPPTRWMDIGAETDIYLARMQWTPGGELLLQRLPRLQNKIELLLADSKTGKSAVILTEEDKAWLEVPGDLKFVGDTDQFLWPSDRSGHSHLYLYDLTGKLLRQVSAGDWDVLQTLAVDAAHRMVYFSASRPTPLEKQICSALLDGGADISQMSDVPGTHAALFSPDAAYYLGTYSSKAVPVRVTLHRSSGHAVALVHDNPLPRRAAMERAGRLGAWEFTTFKTEDGVTLNAALLKPANFDPNKKYPVIMYTYGGPGSQVVNDAFGGGGGLEQYLAQKGYIFAYVDGRGSGGRGRDFMKVTYLNLGHYEVRDQIAGAKWLAGQPFVDGKRIGIWGWSYGGYMSSLCILRGADVFRSAVAVAPVTQWELYDSIYTERYMRRPVDNPKGYAETSPIPIAEKLKGNFLLVHGTADDNVHFQNSARLASEFEKHNKQFRAMYYPGKHHGIEGVSLHVFTMISEFFAQNL